MNILVVADCHNHLLYKDILQKNRLAKNLTDEYFQVMAFLGDNSPSDIRNIMDWAEQYKGINIENICIGIRGNHDNLTKKLPSPIQDCHGKVLTIRGVRFGGFEGSVRYSEESRIMYTQEECSKIMREMDGCDVLLTHSNPQFLKTKIVPVYPDTEALTFKERIKSLFVPPKIQYMEKTEEIQNNCHSGLVGIAEYIDRQRPHICLHGHIHDNYTSVHEGIVIKCCHGVEIISI